MHLFGHITPISPAIVTRIALASVLLLLLSSCGISVSRSEITYYFSHPLLNEEWNPRHFQTTVRSASGKGRSVKKAKGKRRAKKAKKKGPALVATPAQELRGNDMEVGRQEMVLAGRRLLGVGETFTQDSFIRHLLVVNNLGVGRIPEEGTVKFLFEGLGSSRKVKEVKAGDILFLGDGSPEQCVIVEQVESDGTVGFIGYVSGRVSRGVLSLTHASVRRDETSKKVLNTFVGKTQLAGGLLLGAYTLDAHQRMLAGKNASGGHK